MNELKYTITEFDQEKKAIKVEFEDGAWAHIQLTIPLPKTVADLEKEIRQFAAPVEAIEAQSSPDADLSYINDLIGQQRVTERHRMIVKPGEEVEQLDPELEAALAAQEQAEFESRIVDVLKKLGVQVTA